jgi:tetratricopeptide (TPR) repeat protein
MNATRDRIAGPAATRPSPEACSQAGHSSGSDKRLAPRAFGGRSLDATLVLALFGALSCGYACDTTVLAASSTAKVFDRAAPAFEEYFDYDLAGAAAPGSILQLEGVLRVVPENKLVIERLCRAYIGYAFGFVEDAIEVAELAGDYEEADRQRGRARMFYRRARDLAVHWVSLDHEGFQEAVRGGAEDFERWVDRNFDEPEDAGILLWTGYSWGSFINQSKDDMAAVADLPFARILVERSAELDPSYYHGAATTVLAVVQTNMMGGDLDRAQELFDRAFELSERHALLVHVNMARHYAVKRGDRDLFLQLLREVLEAGDPLPAARLSNRISRRRAERYLANIDRYF